MKAFLLTIVCLFMVTPAMAQDYDADMAKSMARCAGFMEEGANVQTTPEQKEKADQSALAYKIGAMYYLPGPSTEVQSQVEDWVKQARAEIDTLDDTSFDSQMKVCPTLHDKVQAALDAMSTKPDNQSAPAAPAPDANEK